MRFLVIFLVLASVTVSAQDIEYGEPEELKDVESIFIDTGTELEVRNNIKNVVEKALPALEITKTADEADVILFYGASYRQWTSGHTNPDGSKSVKEHSAIDGEGLVVRVTDENAIRILWDFKDTKTLIFERRPSTNFARAFVREYKKANGMDTGPKRKRR